MNTFQGISPARLETLLAAFSKARLAVVGDFFLDKYLDIDPAVAEVSIETGKTAHQVVGIRHSPGAAGTVVSNLAALGARRLEAVGFSGDDGEGYELRQGLRALGCGIDHLHVDLARHTPTYLKPRDLTRPGLEGEHERLDTKNRLPTPADVERRVLDSLETLLPDLDALIIADQVEEEDCGVITRGLVEALTALAERFPRVIFWADSRRRIRRFRGVIIKPNQFEAVDDCSAGPEDTVALDQLEAALAQLRGQIGAPVVVTRGPEGMIVSDPQPTRVPGVRAAGPTDPTGAGDSATAGAVLGLASGATLPEAALVGNLVASITVEQLATTGTAHPEQLLDRLQRWHQQNRA